jgi:hypothetical protein
MTDEVWNRRRMKLQEDLRKSLVDLIEHMGSVESLKFQLDDKRMITVNVSTKDGS